MMGVYLKHGDPVAEGCICAGMNKTLIAHKTRRPLLPAQTLRVYSCQPEPIRMLLTQGSRVVGLGQRLKG